MKKLLSVMIVVLFASAFLVMGCDEDGCDVCTDSDYFSCSEAWEECIDLGTVSEATCALDRCECYDTNGCEWGYGWFTCN
jgi:hypothetical protein